MIAAHQARRILGICVVLAALVTSAPAGAHMATERYIPIGQSPGVSHNLTVVGKIEAADPARKTVTVATPSGNLVVEIRQDSKIWVDRSKLKQTNLVGQFADLRQGSTVEVRFTDPVRKRFAAWVKVEAAPSR